MTGQRPGVLVVGAGQAGLQLACSLRDGGFDGDVTLVGAEPDPPYQRPPLSKAYLKGAADRESLLLRAPDFYAARSIELVLGERVIGAEREPDGSGVARCGSGRIIPFTTLVLATGARPSNLAIQGADAAGVHVLRTTGDADTLAAGLGSAADVAVVGGGFIGLEIAASARILGKKVTVLEAASTLLSRAVGPLTAEHLAERHRRAGIDVRLAASVLRLTASGNRVSGVELADRQVISAQTVIVGVGARPRTELAEHLGLRCDNGIIVDEFSVASDGVTFAIGDCAAVPDPTVRGEHRDRVRLESVDNAVEQAKVAAAVILGERRAYHGVPWFWSDQGDAKLQIAGLRRPTDVAVVRGPGDAGRHVVGYFRDGRLVAAETVNAPAEFMTLKKLLMAGRSPTPAVFADRGVALKRLLKETIADAVSVR